MLWSRCITDVGDCVPEMDGWFLFPFFLLSISTAGCLQRIHSHRSVFSLSEFMAECINDPQLWPCLLASLCVSVGVCVFPFPFYPSSVRLLILAISILLSLAPALTRGLHPRFITCPTDLFVSSHSDGAPCENACITYSLCCCCAACVSLQTAASRS